MRMSSPELGMPMPPPRIVQQQSSPPPGYLNRPSLSKEELQFPAGLRVLVVDDDQTTLRVLEVMLSRCLYTVTTCGMATKALELLRENKNKFDLVISDVHMPDMNGFKLLELVGLEMDLPVIMMSVDGDANSVMKGVTHGACDYLMKPVRIEELRNIWQHVVRKKQHGGVKEHESSQEQQEKQKRRVEEADYATSTMSKKRKDVKEEEEDLEQDSEDPSSLKKQRVVWSPDLHRQFVDAVNQLGVDKAFPKKILELMDVPLLTRENVASHLQKYRLYLRKSAAMMCGTPTSGGDVRPMAAASYSTVTGVESAVLGTTSSSAVDSPSMLPFPGIQGGPVIRPSLTSSVFSTQPSNYFPTFTGGNQLEPVIGYGQMQPQLRPVDNVAAVPSVQHQAVRQRFYGNSIGAFQVAPASSPSMVQLLQPRQHQQQQQQQQQQGLNVSMASLAQQHQRLVPGGVSMGINNGELGYGTLCMRASKNAGGPLLVQGNSAGAVAGSLAAPVPLATAPISTSAFNSALDFRTKLPVTNGYGSMVYDNNNQNRIIGGGWQDLAQVTLSPRYSESVASRNFNNNNNFVADSHVNLDVDGRRESESTADSSFKPKMGPSETTTRFGLENQSITAVAAVAAPDDLVSYYLKQQQEDLSYQDNGIGFDGFVLDNVCA